RGEADKRGFKASRSKVNWWPSLASPAHSFPTWHVAPPLDPATIPAPLPRASAFPPRAWSALPDEPRGPLPAIRTDLGRLPAIASSCFSSAHGDGAVARRPFGPCSTSDNPHRRSTVRLRPCPRNLLLCP